MGEVSVSADWLLALHVLRRLAVTQGHEFRMAQMVHVGPVRVLDLRYKLRFQPAAFGQACAFYIRRCRALVAITMLERDLEGIVGYRANRKVYAERRQWNSSFQTEFSPRSMRWKKRLISSRSD
jgi:hypothetical protein